MFDRLKRAVAIFRERDCPRVPPKDKLRWQQGGFAGPFASPGLGVDDSTPAQSGIDASHERQ